MDVHFPFLFSEFLFPARLCLFCRPVPLTDRSGAPVLRTKAPAEENLSQKHFDRPVYRLGISQDQLHQFSRKRHANPVEINEKAVKSDPEKKSR